MPEERRAWAAARPALRADGNCLGVALEDCWRLAGMDPPPLALDRLSTVADAVAALSEIRRPVLLTRRGAGFMERTLQILSARWKGWPIRTSDFLPARTPVLCLRSMRQLYGIARSEAHWVVLEAGDADVAVHDRLWSQIELSFPGARRTAGEELLCQPGPTLLV